MKRIFYSLLKAVVIVGLTTIALPSCFNSWRIKDHRRKYRDPALIGEWINLRAVENLKANPQRIEEAIAKHPSGYSATAGMVFHSNGDMQTIGVTYTKDSLLPKIEKEIPDRAFYTKGGVIYSIELYPNIGDSAWEIAENYLIRGDTLIYPFFEDDDDYGPRYLRGKVTPDLFPERKVK